MATASSAHPFSTCCFQPRSPTTSTGSTMMSLDTRGSPDDNVSPHQPLPSILEVISGTRPGQPLPTGHSSVQPGSALPPPFPPASRPYPGKHTSLRLLHPSTFPSRQHTHPTFSDSPGPGFNGHTSLFPATGRQSSPPSKDVHISNSHKPSAHPMNGPYAHQHPPPPPSFQTPQLPYGQLLSHGHGTPHIPGPHDARGPPYLHPHERRYANRARHAGSWSYSDSLSRIELCSRAVVNFAGAYERIAHEHNGSQSIAERLPTEQEFSEMLANVEHIKRSLEQVWDVVQVSIRSKRVREDNKANGQYDGAQDVAVYRDDIKNQFVMADVKKRRGRAAPPGGCHNCNSVDTPEWRSGPDGVRTLCNACGLYYAKLERERLLEDRSLRRKTDGRN